MNRCKHIWKKPEEGDIFKFCRRCPKRKKIVTKPKKKALKALCDKEWSRITKLKHIFIYGKTCAWCKQATDSLQSDHIFNRWKHSTRWNVNNCIGLCAGCHLFRKKREPLAWAQMVQKEVDPDVLAELETKSQEMIQPDYDVILAYLRECERAIGSEISQGAPPKESRILDVP